MVARARKGLPEGDERNDIKHREDLVSDMVTHVYSKAEKWSGHGSFAAWSSTVMAHKLKDLVKSETAHRKRFTPHGDLDLTLGACNSPEDVIARLDFTSAMNNLPPVQAELVTRRACGYAITDVPVANPSVYLTRGIDKLKTSLDEDYALPPTR